MYRRDGGILKRRHHDWTDRSLEVRAEAGDVRTIRSDDSLPVYEDTITFYDPFERRKVTGTVRHSSGHFDSAADGIVYTFTLDIRD